MNSDRALIIAVPLFVAVLVRCFSCGDRKEWNTGEATVVAKPQVVQALWCRLTRQKKRH